MALWAEGQPVFLASLLAAYARAERLDDAGLAGALGCDAATLTSLRLCRAPREDACGLREDVEHLAERFSLDAARLAAVVQRGRVAARFAAAGGAGRGRLLAARDPDEGPPVGGPHARPAAVGCRTGRCLLGAAH